MPFPSPPTYIKERRDRERQRERKEKSSSMWGGRQFLEKQKEICSTLERKCHVITKVTRSILKETQR